MIAINEVHAYLQTFFFILERGILCTQPKYRIALQTNHFRQSYLFDIKIYKMASYYAQILNQ